MSDHHHAPAADHHGHESADSKGHPRPAEDLEHQHDHHHGDDHGHDHGIGHSHGGGLLDRFGQLFGHSHDLHDQVDDALESNERGIWALKVSLVGLGLTALFQIVIVVVSGSTALLADTIHNFGDAATSLPLWVAFSLARRGRTRRFTYGLGRGEDLAGVLIVAMIFFSACVAAYESVVKLINPAPVLNLGWVAVAALVGFVGNELVGNFRIRVGNEIGSAALIADGQHSRVDGFTSLAVLIGVAGAAVGVPILDPLVGLVITAAILFIVKDTALAVFRRLLDGIDPDVLTAIEDAPTHVAGVRGVHEVRARWIGHKVQADLHITVDPTLSVAQGHVIAEAVRSELAAHVRTLGTATIHVDPAEGAGR
jgi:cation diffusion facilitator family transporter